MRRALPLLLLTLAGCGSTPPSDLPAAAGPGVAPPLARAPAGVPLARAAAARAVTDPRRAGRFRIAGRTLVAAGRPVEVPGLLEPTGLTVAPGGDLLVVDGRARELVRLDGRTLRIRGRADAGIGPTTVVAGGAFAYVADTAGDALLVFGLDGRGVDPLRYVHLPGRPYGLAIDRRTAFRVWVGLTGANAVVGLPAHGRPRPVERFPTVRGPHRLAADPSTGRVVVLGRDGARAIAAA